jgi:hypothetical protein
MLSKLLAALVVSMAVAFAGYSFVHDGSGSHCCPGSVVIPSVSSNSSCCEEPVSACCEITTGTAATCPAAVCPAAKDAAASCADEKITKVEDKSIDRPLPG